MKQRSMTNLLTCAAAVFCVAGSVFATPVVITRWGFDNAADSVTSPAPSTGSGTMLLIGGVTAASTGAYASQSGSSDTTPGSSAFNTSNYPAVSAASGTAGVEWDVPTTGYQNITFSYDIRSSNSASRWNKVQYSLNGTTWIDGLTNTLPNANFVNGNILDLTTVTGANNNPNFKVRLVTIFSPNDFVANSVSYTANTAYQPTSTVATQAYGVTGTYRFDAVTFSGEPTVSLPPSVSAGTSSPDAGCNGAITTLTVTVNPGQNPVSSGLTVVANLTAIGGSATQAFFDDGTNGDVTPGDNIFTFATAASGTPGVKTLPITVTDAQSRTGTGAIHYGVGDCSRNANSAIVISQVYGGGGVGGATFDGDYVELFNRSRTAVDVTGWSVQYASSGGAVSASQVAPISGVIGAGKYYLVRMSNEPVAGSTPLPTADATAPGTQGILMSNISGRVALVSTITPLGAACSDATIKDYVGYGSSAICFEGAGHTINEGSGGALYRKLDGCQDSNENFNDFELLFPVPRNSASPVHLCGPACGTADFNGDGDIGTDQDIEAFFACLAGNCCGTCGTADFNGDGDIGTDQDIEAFFRVLAGGAC